MTNEPVRLDEQQRALALAGIRRCCCRRHWDLVAAHVRQTHVHLVVAAPDEPDAILKLVKAYASRELTRSGGGPQGSPWWTKHGSTRPLLGKGAIIDAIEYVVERQGAPMAVFHHWDGRR